jgi:hypothetical protein
VILVLLDLLFSQTVSPNPSCILMHRTFRPLHSSQVFDNFGDNMGMSFSISAVEMKS